MPECAKAHLQQSRTSEFSGRTPRSPAFRVWVRKGRKTGKNEGQGKGEGKKLEVGDGKGERAGEGMEGWGGSHSQTKIYHYTAALEINWEAISRGRTGQLNNINTVHPDRSRDCGLIDLSTSTFVLLVGRSAVAQDGATLRLFRAAFVNFT